MPTADKDARLSPEVRADLAALLRQYADNPAHCYVPIHQATLIEVAREIERLRNEVAAARRDALEEAAGAFERLAEIVTTPAFKVSDADKEFYSAIAEHFEPLGRSVLPNWKAIAAAIRALAERETTP